MTQAEATTMATTLNAALATAGADGLVKWGIYANWNTIHEKYWDVVLYPKDWDGKFTGADFSQKQGFARLSSKAQMTAPFPSSYTDFNTKFNAQKALDAEMNEYLKP